MGAYERKTINCLTCGMQIGEVDGNANILLPRCGMCSILESEENEILTYIVNRFVKTVKNVISIPIENPILVNHVKKNLEPESNSVNHSIN